MLTTAEISNKRLAVIRLGYVGLPLAVGFGKIYAVTPEADSYEAVVFAVPHTQLVEQGVDALRAYGKENHVFYDLKAIFPIDASDLRL